MLGKLKLRVAKMVHKNNNRKFGSILVIVALAVTQFSILPLPKIMGDLNDPSALITHETIYIYGNSQFMMANGVVGGNGTKSNPYIIENWSINATNEDGIKIENTNKYFVIRNCYIYEGVPKNFTTSGIHLYNVKNATMVNNRIISNYYGIYLLKSDSNTISNNVCNLSHYAGIYFRESYENTIIDNTCLDNFNGIVLEDSNLNTVIDHSCLKNDEGLCLINSKSNLIVNNTLNSNTFDGIFMYDSILNVISNNICNSNGRNGIHLWYSDLNSINNNSCNLSGYEGICFRISTNNNITDNTCNSNYYEGIGIEDSTNNILSSNICNLNNGDGIVLSSSNSNTVTKNTCKLNNHDGISLDSKFKPSNHNTIINNFCEANGGSGISSLGGESNLIMSNNCNLNTKKGIYVFGNSNTLRENMCNMNDDGIYMDSSSASILINNNCNSNNVGISLVSSNNNILRSNTMVKCGILIDGKLLKNWNTHYIDTSNTINSNPVYYWRNQTAGTVPAGAGEVILANCTNIEIIGQDLSNGTVGILFGFTDHSRINITTCLNNNLEGMRLYSSAGNIIDNCSISLNSNHDFYFKGNSKNNLAINSTFDTINFLDSTSELIIKNYLDIQVNSSYNFPISDADILVQDNNRKIFATAGYSGSLPKTNDAGQCRWILITDRIYKGSPKAVENSTIVNIKYLNKSVENNNRNINMSTSHFEFFNILNLLPNKIKLKSPYNNSYINSSTPELIWYIGTDADDEPLTHILQLDELGNDWKTPILNEHVSIGDSTWKLTKPLKERAYQWRVCADDGNETGPWSEVWKFTIDTTAPSSMVLIPINNGFYNKLNELSGSAIDPMNGTGVVQVEIAIKKLSDNLYWNGSNWTEEKFWLSAAGTESWAYDSSSVQWITDNYYNIRSRAIDYVNNQELPGEGIIFMYDDKAPECSIIINDNAMYTNSTMVNLSLKAIDNGSGVAVVAYSSDSISWSLYEVFDATKQYDLPAGDGDKSVYYKVMDRANNTAIAQDLIILDMAPPYSLFIIINNGTKVTNSTKVNLKLHAVDDLSGVSQMSFSSDAKNWSEWQNYSELKSYILSPEDGIKIVYFKVKDLAGNIAEPKANSIILNTTTTNIEKTPEKDKTKKAASTVYYIVIIIIIVIILIFVILVLIGNRQSKQKLRTIKNENQKTK